MSDKNSRKTRVGVVASDKMDKTIVVGVDRRFKERMYKKFVTRRLKYKAHDPGNECRTGDLVEIEETRPLSKDKRWRVIRIIEKAPVI